MEKVLGLDLGITSVGSALIDLDYENLKNTNILHSNIRIFEAPITPKEKTSLQLIRGENRRARNSKENNSIRRKKIVNILLKYKFIDKNEIKNVNTNLPKSKVKREIIVKVANYLFEDKKNANNILELRYKALNEKLSTIQLARLLYSMNNHRGVSYEDTRSSKNIPEKKLEEFSKKDINEYADGSSDKLLYGLLNFKNAFINSSKYQTVGEFLYKEYKEKFRNSPKRFKDTKQSDFMFVIPRKNIVDELNFIFKKQKEFKNEVINDDFIKEYLEAFEWEEDSPAYDELVANCSIKENEKAASKYLVESQFYIYLEKLYNLSYKTKDEYRYKNLDIETIVKIIKHINTKTIKYSKLRELIEKELNLQDVMFKGVSDYSKYFIDLTIFVNLASILSFPINILELFKDIEAKELFNKVVNILAYEPKISQKEKKLEELKIVDEKIVDKLLEIKIKGNLSYCKEVLEQICNGMLSGLIPHYAKEEVQKAYPKKPIIKGHLLPPLLDTDFPIKNNQVVVRALSQMRLVINDTLKHYRKVYENPNWFFDKVVIETAREFLNKEQVKKYDDRAKENEKLNKQAIEFCEKYGKAYPTKEEILKARLFLQQDGLELYPSEYNISTNSANFNKIDAQRLFDEAYCEIDHTLPISRSLDDSFSNKTLVLSSTNQNKGNKTPYEFLNKELFEIMEDSLNKKINILGYKKVSNLTNKEFKELDGFIARDLNDTRMITKYAGLYIQNYLAFPKNDKIKRRVFANNGKITSLLRKSWGIGAKNRNNHLHHGEDAILIALSDNSLIKNISTYYGIQTELEKLDFSKDGFDKLFKNNKNIKEYIVTELKKEDIDIENIDFSKISKKEISSKIFRIIAQKSYPREDFLDIFRKAIHSAIVTHQERVKINGQIHKDTLEKLSKKTNDDVVLVRGGFATNGEFIRYDVFKNSKNRFEFIKITAKHHGLSLDKLPLPQDINSNFLFSIYPKTCLNFIIEEQKEFKELKGLFRKISSSLYIDSIKSIEDEFFKFKLESLSIDYLLSDDLPNFEKEHLKKIQELLNIGKLDKKNKIETLANFVEESLVKIRKYIEEYFSSYKIFFTFDKTTSNETFLLKRKLKDLGSIEELNDILISTNTIIFKISEKKLISPYFVLASTKIKSIKKIKSDIFGNEEIIENEKREPLLEK